MAIDVVITVNGQDCSSEPGINGLETPERLEAIAKVFSDAAQALREHKHGMVRLVNSGGDWIACVGLDDGRSETDLDGYEYPVLSETEIQ